MDLAELGRILDIWADEEGQAAARARSNGDERAHSISLMKQNMYSTMLKTLAAKAPQRLASTADEMTRRAEENRLHGDLDSADRCEIQRACIERVQALVRKLGGEA